MKISYKKIILIGITVAISSSLYLIWSWKTIGLGFPLDDAWIHQTYARNFGTKLQWSFINDQVSGGSTGPLWGFLLAVLYALKIPPIWGTYFLGFLLLWGSSVSSLPSVL